jgi:hypothetical protein
MNPEPDIELAPFSERLKIGVIAVLTPWVAILWSARLLGWL